MTPTELNECFVSAITTLCEYEPASRVVREDGMARAFSHLPLPWNYFAFCGPSRSAGEFEARVAAAADYGRRGDVPWRLVMLDDWLYDNRSEACLARYGLTRVAILSAMWADDLQPSTRVLPEMTFQRATDAESLAPVVSLNNTLYDLDSRAGASLYLGYVDQPGACAIVGEVDGERVSCAAVLPIGRALYVGAVATRADRRGLGFGEAVLRRAVQESASSTGLRRSVLFALPRRVPFYRALGCTVGAQLRVYLPDNSPNT